jgi:hypothetical protein
VVRRLLIALLATSCGGPPFDAVRAQTIVVGQSRDQVRATMGAPDHMAKTIEHPKSCIERWTYGELSGRAFLVDFDEQGRVCEVAIAVER